MVRTGGPLPKRSSERRRRNKVPGETVVQRTGAVPVPAAPKDLHSIARRWYLSLKKSGQSDWFEPSDWAAALVLAQKLSSHFAADSFAIRLCALAARLIAGPEAKTEIAAELVEMSLNTPRGSAAEFGVIWAGMEALLTTESARRRARIEVERGLAEAEAGAPKAIDEYRKMVGG